MLYNAQYDRMVSVYYRVVQRLKNVHFVGISGIGMSSVALFAKDMGYNVTGSCDTASPRTELLTENAIDVYVGHKTENVKDNMDYIVFTTAVSDDNPEMVKARELGIEILPRLFFLKILIKESGRDLTGITGTDGKTSTTAMIAHVAIKEGLDPTVILGGIHEDLEFGNYRSGTGPIIAEIDESDGYFRDLKVKHAVLTNLRGDHLEHYKQDFQRYKDYMIQFITNAENRVIPADLDIVLPNSTAFSENDFAPLLEKSGKTNDLYTKINIICAAQACRLLGIPPIRSIECLSDFKNVDRRMSTRFSTKKMIIVDDYAHTPSEIEFSLQSLANKYKDRKIILIFEAHRYTRLKRDMKRFAQKLASPLIDSLILMPVYSAYEHEEPEVFEAFKTLLKDKKVDFLFEGSPENLANTLFSKASDDLAVLFTGAGHSSTFSKKVSDFCTQKEIFFT